VIQGASVGKDHGSDHPAVAIRPLAHHGDGLAERPIGGKGAGVWTERLVDLGRIDAAEANAHGLLLMKDGEGIAIVDGDDGGGERGGESGGGEGREEEDESGQSDQHHHNR
jgi:hypothetical protein